MQVWHRLAGKRSTGWQTFAKELIWRDYAQAIIAQFPDYGTKSYRDGYSGLWRTGKAADADFAAWTKGQTGYPIVDAGMRQLWQTGWMHNRVRMIAASFLVKHLLQPWQDGAAWFWDTLVDADAGNNSVSWQWIAGSGLDSAPYFRVFNPVAQGEKFDPAGRYVRRFVPELARLPDKYIHRPWEAPEAVLREAGVSLGHDYPRPVVEHAAGRRRALDAFAAMRKEAAAA